MKILVLAGGYSPERDVSLTSGSLIANALVGEGHDVCLADVYLGADVSGDICAMFNKDEKPVYKVTNTVPDLAALKEQSGNGEALIGGGIIELCRAADVVFLALHGAMGENGQLQATLDNYGIKYTGSGYVGSLLAMDKDISKKMFVGAGVNTPEWLYYDSAADCSIDEIEQKIGYPCVVKPCSCGSSVGISIVDDHDGLVKALSFAGAYEDKILVEKKIEGRELTVGILDGEVLPIIEIIPTEGFYDYTNKYQAGKTLEICPAEIDDSIRDAAAEQTRRAFVALRLSGYSRFDFIVDKDGKPWCLEANTLPGMTPTSLLPQMAAARNMSYGKLCCKIVELALEK